MYQDDELREYMRIAKLRVIRKQWYALAVKCGGENNVPEALRYSYQRKVANIVNSTVEEMRLRYG